MLSVDDINYSPADFDRWYSRFANHAVLGDCAGKCFAVRVTEPAVLIALCLYLKANGGSVFPLAADTPLAAARRRAELSRSDYLLVDEGHDVSLDLVEAVTVDSGAFTRAEPSLIQMSSGTTGEPKCVARSWASIEAEVVSYVSHFRAGTETTPIVACPVNHSYGLISGVLVALERGVVPLVIKNSNPKFILRKLRDANSPLLYASPTLLAAVTMLARGDGPIFAVMTSGTLLPHAWFENIRSRVRHVHQQYGCSEVGCVAIGQNIETANELGIPLPHLEIVTGVNAAEPREIVVKAPGGKVVETRDLGYLKGDTLYFVSRVDDMINVAGLNVYPSEVEDVVLRMPGVREAVAFKRSHSFGNDQVCLYFVSDAPIPHQHVRTWCSERLSAHQVPMTIEQVPRIARLPNGKLSRKALAESGA